MSDKPRVILGPMVEIVREGLTLICQRDLDLQTSERRGSRLVVEARARDAVAIIADPSDIDTICGDLPCDLLLIGVSRSSGVLLVCWGTDRVQFVPGNARGIVKLVRSWARSIPRRPALAMSGRK